MPHVVCGRRDPLFHRCGDAYSPPQRLTASANALNSHAGHFRLPPLSPQLSAKLLGGVRPTRDCRRAGRREPHWELVAFVVCLRRYYCLQEMSRRHHWVSTHCHSLLSGSTAMRRKVAAGIIRPGYGERPLNSRTSLTQVTVVDMGEDGGCC